MTRYSGAPAESPGQFGDKSTGQLERRTQDAARAATRGRFPERRNRGCWSGTRGSIARGSIARGSITRGSITLQRGPRTRVGRSGALFVLF
jgi:hypothetical protein